MQKVFYMLEDAPTTHTFEYSVLGSNRQYPYLLGFDSNLIPNSCNFYMFQSYICEDSEYLGQSEIFVYIYIHSLGKIPNNWEIH